ncbi:conserved hypothetical protein [Rubrivivax sp. A210]|uniref:hypothetical protein n=1 Tax=Rubrivivax sp. A210 TaxID=2772301 RepID=UPI001919F3C9|nr:hypothetical protein [Rubrivivax sp. A210]CAD5374539.1 conserved hypothetical protein [Rubrivivax sp. A210]
MNIQNMPAPDTETPSPLPAEAVKPASPPPKVARAAKAPKAARVDKAAKPAKPEAAPRKKAQASLKPADKPVMPPAPAKKVTKPATPPQGTKPVVEAKPVKKPAKPRPQLVRDSFTMPEGDFGLIAALKARALTAHRAAKKSELLRAGLQALAALDAAALAAALDRLAPVKTGRPKKGR